MFHVVGLLVAASTSTAFAANDAQSLACKIRQVGVDFAQSLQPFRPAQVFSEVADALNGADDANGCIVYPKTASRPEGAATISRVLSFALPTNGLVVFVDPVKGSDKGKTRGQKIAPFRSLTAALAHVRAWRIDKGVKDFASAPKATLVLRQGTFHLAATLNLVHVRIDTLRLSVLHRDLFQ